jgi:uncharacterized protein YrzB (UPF0473 family)
MESTLFIINDEGVEEEFNIILTFTNPDTEVKYVIFQELGEDEQVYAASYTEESDIAGTLTMVEDDDEFDMIQEVLDAFSDEE